MSAPTLSFFLCLFLVHALSLSPCSFSPLPLNTFLHYASPASVRRRRFIPDRHCQGWLQLVLPRMMHRFLGTSTSPLTLVPDFLFLAWTHPLPCNVDTSLLKRFLQNYTLSDSPDYVTGYVWSNIKSNEPQILKSTAYATKDYDIVN